MNNRKALILVALLLLSIVSGWAGRDILFSLQWPFFEALRTTASIVLAVMGAWVTILYPKALESVLKRSLPLNTDHEQRIEALLLPVKLSTVVVIAVLVIGPLALYLKQLAWVGAHLDVFRGLSFGLLVFLTLAEMAAVVLTLWPIEAAKGEVEAARKKNEQRDALFKLVQRN